MKKILLALFALSLMATPVGATALPVVGDRMTIATVWCDSPEQLKSILDAAHEANDFSAGFVRFEELRKTPNAVNEPTCAMMPAHGVVASIVSIGPALLPDKTTIEAYAIEFIGEQTGNS